MVLPAQRRDGLYSIIKVGRNLCRLITIFEPVIRRLYPNNAALHAALTAANAACATLVAAAVAEKDAGV